MSAKHLLEKGIFEALEAFGDTFYNIKVTPEMQEESLKMAKAQLQDIEPLGVKREEVYIPSIIQGDPPVRCLKYSAIRETKTTGAILQIHGGGWEIGNPELMEHISIPFVKEVGATVLSVDYRLAPKYKYPAPVDDCYSCLSWLHENADELNIDPDKIAIYGESAGGTLAAAVTQIARDKKQYPICFQAMMYPALDDTTGTEENPRDPLIGEFLWTREKNIAGWASYLGDAERIAPQVPAKATSLENLPPAWIGTAMLDLFRDENIEYAHRLMQSGVPTELIVYPNVCHGFDALIPESEVTLRFKNDLFQALKRGLS